MKVALNSWALGLMLVAFGVGAAPGCGGGGGSVSPPMPTDPTVLAAARVGPAGGTVAVADPGSAHAGLALEIPAGALAEPVDITIRKADADGTPNAGYAYVLEPSGLRMAAPCTLTAPFDPNVYGELAESDPSSLVVLLTSANGETEVLPSWSVDARTSTVTADLRHFSLAQVWHPTTYSLFLQPTLLDKAFCVETSIDCPSGGCGVIVSEGESLCSTPLGRGSMADFWRSSKNLILIHGWKSNAFTFHGGNDLVWALEDHFDNIAIFQWRTGNSVEDAADALAAVIRDNATSSFGCTIIAHSMGGLVARHAIEREAGSIDEHVDALVTLCTPHDGAPAGWWATLISPLLIEVVQVVPSIRDGRDGLPEPADTPDTPYYLIGSSTDTVVPEESALGLDFVPPSRKRVYANQEHSEVHEDASENGVVDQILSWLGLVEEEVEWQEGFESFTAGTWPSGWTGDANASSSGNGIDDAIAHSGANSLKLFGSLGGCWGALAYRAIGAEDPYELELYVRNGNESISGCHPERAYIGLRKGTHWSNPARMFLWFRGNGVIEDAAGNSLGTYDVLDWIKVRVKYERPNASDVVLSYWIDDVYQRSTTYAAHEEEDDLTNLDLTTQEGSVWFDDIRISR